MTIATGIAKQVAYKVEPSFGVAPSAGSAQLLRRVMCDLDQTKATYKSAEITPTYQITDFRHGVKKAAGSIKGELSPGGYSTFMGDAVRRAFTTLTATSGASITIAGTGPYTVTRAAGSWLTDGIKVGHVVRLSVGVFNAANINRNLFVISMTATVLTVMPLNGIATTPMVAEGPIATSTVTMVGKQTFAPTTGQTDNSYSIEQRYVDASLYERFVGCKVDKFGIAMPASGIVTCDVGMMGQYRDLTAGTAYFTSPTAVTTFGVLASAVGVLYVGSTAIATITGFNLNISGGYTMPAGVVGSNIVPAIFPGRIDVSGDFSAYFDTGTYRDAFDNETPLALSVVLATGTGASADFIGITLPNIKLSGAQKDDGEIGLSQKLPFQAIYNSAGGAGMSTEQTTVMFQDSQA
jgi:hypothetical protein